MYNYKTRSILEVSNSRVNLLILLHRFDVLVGSTSIALGIVKNLSPTDGVFQAFDLIWMSGDA